MLITPISWCRSCDWFSSARSLGNNRLRFVFFPNHILTHIILTVDAATAMTKSGPGLFIATQCVLFCELCPASHRWLGPTPFTPNQITCPKTQNKHWLQHRKWLPFFMSVSLYYVLVFLCVSTFFCHSFSSFCFSISFSIKTPLSSPRSQRTKSTKEK